MASKGEVGIDLDVGRVPLREAGMEPFEIMVSESQERMLCVCEPERLADVLAVCERWEVHGTAIGEVTDSGAMRIFRGDELVADVPVAALVDDCPVYELAPARPSAPLYEAPRATLARESSLHDALPALLASPNIASRRPLFEQYDWIVQSRTVRRPEEADAAVLVLPGGGGLGVSIDGNGRRVAADPYVGTIAAVLECAANLACVGAEPLGVTNNLNFGNPEKPHIAWQLSEAVRGLGDACRALEVPVTGGNVSLYNEGGAGAIYPTPVVGMVGHLPDAARAGRLGFAREGDAVALVGWSAAPALAASELAKLWGEPLPDGLPAVDLAAARGVLETVRDAVRAGAVSSCHDVAEGGLLVAVAESCLAGGLGATLELADGDPWAALFGEQPAGFVVSGARDALEALAAPVRVLGTAGGDALAVGIGGEQARWPLAELRAAHEALGRFFP
jgi:phosphoribosylformylglycinamidine synthase